MINIKHVSKNYQVDNNLKVKALVDINLLLPNQGLIFVVGKSGSGKSTFMNLLAGLDQATEGSIEVFGHKLEALSSSELNQYRNTMVGIVFQEYNLIPELNVYENIRLGLTLHGVKSENQVIENILTFVGLQGYKERKIDELSGGQQQRVAIARALAKSSKIILADEPTGSLDSKTGEEITKLLKKISQKQLVIVITHDQSLAKAYADQIIELKDGRIIENQVFSNHLDYEPLKSVLIKPHMPHKLIFEMSVKSLMFKMSHFIFSVMLLAIMIALTAIIISMESYVPEAYRNELLNQNEFNTMTFYKQKNFSDVNQSFQTSLNNQDLMDIEALGIEDMVIVNTNLESLSIDESTIRSKTGYERRFFITELLGVAHINLDTLNHLKMDLVTGSLPVERDEVAISYYTYWLLKSLGVKDYLGITIDVSEPNDLIGKRINLSSNIIQSVKIVGIIDTKLPMATFGKLLENDDTWIVDYPNLLSEFEYKMNHEYHNLFYISKALLETIEDKGIKLQPQPYTLSLSKSNQVSTYSYIRKINDDVIATSLNHTSGVYLSLNKWLSYNPNKALNLYETYFEWLNKYIKDENKITKEKIYEALVYYYDLKGINETIDHYDTWLEDSIYYELYAGLLYGSLTNFMPSTSNSIFYLNNSFGESGKDLQIKAYQEIIPTLVIEDVVILEFKYTVDHIENMEVDVLGIILNQQETNLYVSDLLYESLYARSIDYNRFMVIAHIEDQNLMTQVNHLNYSDNQLKVRHYLFNEIDKVESNIQLYRIILPALLVISLIIFAIFFSQIIHLTILHHIKQIGILIASGFKMIYIFLIYFYASIIIGLCAFIIGTTLTEIGIYWINIYILMDTDLLFLFSTSTNTYVLVASMLIVVLSVNVGFNVYVRLKKQPIFNINII